MAGTKDDKSTSTTKSKTADKPPDTPAAPARPKDAVPPTRSAEAREGNIRPAKDVPAREGHPQEASKK